MKAIVYLLFLCIVQGVTHAESVSVVMVGDVMLADGPGRVIARGQDPFAAFKTHLRNADIRVANLECVIALHGRALDKPWTFRAHPRSLKWLEQYFDAVSLANNHSGDYGHQAFAEMLGYLERAQIAYFGGGRDLSAAHTPLILERHGLRVALLGYNEFMPRNFEADFDRAGIAWSDDEQVLADIRRARETHGADLVIPFMHWGVEHESVANRRQRELARVMIDAGADAVVGGHPHVTQDTEVYRGRPIIYSLGNFVFDGFTDPANNTGWLLHLTLDRAGVAAWRSVVARIDRQGLPHPATVPGDCWRRGDAKAQPCGVME